MILNIDHGGNNCFHLCVQTNRNLTYVFVYWLGKVCPNRELCLIFPAELIFELGNPAMLSDPSLIGIIPWPKRENWNIPFIQGRVLMTGGNKSL